MSPFIPPDGFFDQQREDVLHAVRAPWRIRFAAAAGLAATLAIAVLWPRQQPCASYACLLEATPAEELPVEWALEGLAEVDSWEVWPNPETLESNQ